MNLTPLDPALMAAVWAQDRAGVRRWLTRPVDESIDPHPRDFSMHSALVAASQMGCEPIALALLEAGANPRFEDGKALAWAIASDRAELSEAFAASIFESRTSGRMWLATIGWDPLVEAAEANAERTMEAWARRGFLGVFRPDDLQKGLSSACLKGGSKRVADLLIDAGVGLGERAPGSPSVAFGLNAICLAARNPRSGPLEALIEPDRLAQIGPLALGMALSNVVRQPAPPLDSVRALSKAIDWASTRGSSDIAHSMAHCASHAECLPSLKILVEHGAPVDGFSGARLENGRPDWAKSQDALLFQALRGGCPQGVRALFDLGAQTGLCDEPLSPRAAAAALSQGKGVSPACVRAAQALLACAEQSDLLAVAEAARQTRAAPAAPPRKPLAL